MITLNQVNSNDVWVDIHTYINFLLGFARLGHQDSIDRIKAYLPNSGELIDKFLKAPLSQQRGLELQLKESLLDWRESLGDYFGW